MVAVAGAIAATVGLFLPSFLIVMALAIAATCPIPYRQGDFQGVNAGVVRCLF
jgi:chromate transport protein ChrA